VSAFVLSSRFVRCSLLCWRTADVVSNIQSRDGKKRGGGVAEGEERESEEQEHVVQV